MKILINLLGGQPAPAFMANRIINPDKTYFICSKETSLQCELIANAIHGMIYEKVVVSPFSYADCAVKIRAACAKHSKDKVTINLTAGTKIMSIAGFKIFNELGWKMIYIDSQNHNYITIKKDHIRTTPVKLQMSVEDYFRIHGHNIITKNKFSINGEYERTVQIMEKYYPHVKNIVRNLSRRILNQNFVECYDWHNKHNCIRFNREKNRGELKLKIGRETAKTNITNWNHLKYITGGFWFEDVVYNRIKQSKLFDDVRKNLHILSLDESLNAHAVNEIDIAAISNQTLHIFECKSGNLENAMVDKLRLLKTVIGKYSRICLVTLYDPVDDIFLRKIKDFGIRLITYKKFDESLKELKEEVISNPVL